MANAAKNERLSNMFICTLSKINNNKFDLFAKDHKKNHATRATCVAACSWRKKSALTKHKSMIAI